MRFSGLRHTRLFCLLALLCATLPLPVSLAQEDLELMGPEQLLNSALTAISARDYQKANRYLRKALPALKEMDQANNSVKRAIEYCDFYIGVCSIELEQYSTAAKELGAYVRKYPNGFFTRDARILEAECYALQGDWQAVIKTVQPIINDPQAQEKERLAANQLLADAFYKLEKWAEAIKPLLYIFRSGGAKLEAKIEAAARATTCLVRLDRMEDLFEFLPAVYQTPARYGIELNMALIEAGDRNYEAEKFSPAILLYRLVHNKQEIIDYMESRIRVLTSQLERLENTSGLNVNRATLIKKSMQRKIQDYRQEIQAVKAFPDYDQEVIVRSAQTYVALEMYWEAILLYRSIYDKFPEHELADQALYAAFATALQMNHLTRAVIEGKDYMKAFPKGEYYDEVTSLLVRLAIQENNWEEGLAIAREAITVNPEHRSIDEMLHYIGFCNFQLDNLETALLDFDKVLQDYPDSGYTEATLYWHAMGQLFLGQYPPALSEFTALLGRYDSGPYVQDASFRKGVAEYGTGDFKTARLSIEAFTEKFPDSELLGEAYFMLGDIHASWGALDTALDYYAKVWYCGINMVQVNYATFQAAKTLELEQRWDEIIALFREYLVTFKGEEKYSFTQAAYWIGTAQRQQNDIAGAMKTFFDAIVEWGDDPFHYGIDMIIRDLIEEQAALKGRPVNDDFMTRLFKEVEKAREGGRKTLELRLLALFAGTASSPEAQQRLGESMLSEANILPAGPISLVAMGRAAAQAGKNDLALKIYEHFLDVHATSDLSLDAMKGVAEARMVAKDYDKAEVLLREMVSRYASFPEAGWAQKSLGDIYQAQERYEDAIDAYTTVLAVKEWRGPLYPETLYNIGLCHESGGERNKAFSFFQRIYVMYESYTEWAARAYIKSAHLLEQEGRRNEAIKTLEEMMGKEALVDTQYGQDARKELQRLRGGGVG